MTTEPDDALPGLEPPAPTASQLERATRATIAALSHDGQVRPGRDDATVALAIELAQIISEKRRSGRMSTIGNDARVLMELLGSLVPDAAAADADSDLARAMAAWSEALTRGGTVA